MLESNNYFKKQIYFSSSARLEINNHLDPSFILESKICIIHELKQVTINFIKLFILKFHILHIVVII